MIISRAEEGITAMAAVGVINASCYWRKLLEQKKIANLDDLTCALGGAVK